MQSSYSLYISLHTLSWGMDRHHMNSAGASISTRTRCAFSNPKSEVLPRSNLGLLKTLKRFPPQPA